MMKTVAALLGALALSSAAWAHENAWINDNRYRGIDGQHCCGGSGFNPDCVALPDDGVVSSGGGWRIIATGEIVPYAETQVSEDTHFWRCKKSDGSRRCFFAPDVGS